MSPALLRRMLRYMRLSSCAYGADFQVMIPALRPSPPAGERVRRASPAARGRGCNGRGCNSRDCNGRGRNGRARRQVVMGLCSPAASLHSPAELLCRRTGLPRSAVIEAQWESGGFARPGWARALPRAPRPAPRAPRPAPRASGS